MTLRRTKAGGFTLLEMLVALALMSILATALYASLSIGLRARKTAEAAVQPVRAAGLALMIVGQDLDAALPPTGTLAGAFLGEDQTDAATAKDADTLTWHAAVGRPKEGASDVARLELAVGTPEGSTDRALLRRSVRNLLAPTEQEPVEEVVCRGVVSLNLRYFDGSAWQDTWDSSAQDNTLPLAVEVTIEIEREPKTTDESNVYRLTRVFAPPCARLASSSGSVVRREGAW